MYLLSYFCSIYTLIPLESNVIIALSTEPDWQIVVEDTLVRLKHVPEGTYSDYDDNICRIINQDQLYRLDYNQLSIFKEKGAEDVLGKFYDVPDEGFLFDIISTEFGQKITSEEKCLQKSVWDAKFNGYKLKFSTCTSDIYQHWEIRRALKRVKDNHFPHPEIFEHDRWVRHKSK